MLVLILILCMGVPDTSSPAVMVSPHAGESAVDEVTPADGDLRQGDLLVGRFEL